ncbi:endolytic transglycosylase MltG [Candidatus Gracilibacteria bacterium]|nr:endolytic transglycosylase MltG [Candidatus Gracilibacteria bacterium]
MKKILWFVLFVVLVLAIDFYRFQHAPLIVVRHNLVVKLGDNLGLLVGSLPELSDFRARNYFALYSKLVDPVMKPGNHVLNSGDSLLDVMAAIASEPEDVKVTLLEGDRLEQYAAKLAANQVMDESAALRCFRGCEVTKYREWLDAKTGYEGFLFPDTYNFQVGMNPSSALTKILDNFQAKVGPLLATKNTLTNGYSLREKVIVASLLEREGITLEDKKMISGIIYQRLREGMRLDIDASVLYVLGDWRAEITYQALQSDSPYNTRKQAGLPPGPICNPGIDSLSAAFEPIGSRYFYYLTDSQGRMHYAETLEGHNQNKQKYL